MPHGIIQHPVDSSTTDKNLDDNEEIETKPFFKSKDIHFIHEDVSTKNDSTSGMSIILFFLWLLLVPIIIFFKQISAIFLPAYSYFFPSHRWNYSTKKIITKYETMLNNSIESNAPEKFYTLFIQFLAESFHTPISEVNQDWVRDKLSSLNDSSNEKWNDSTCEMDLIHLKVDSFIKFLNECAQYSFASKNKMGDDSLQNEAQLKEIVKKARYWLITIHSQLNRQPLPKK